MQPCLLTWFSYRTALRALIKPYAFEMYVRVRVLDEQEEKGLFGRHMADQSCMQKSLSRCTTRVI
jgi:hypothetical protein